MQVTIIGLDISKSVFQVHGVNEPGEPLLRRRVRRREVLGFFANLEPCVVGIEACHSSQRLLGRSSAFYHDSAAALVNNGRAFAAV